MTFKSKRTLVSMMAGVVLAIAYIVHALGKNAPSREDLSMWALTLLVFIGISVLTMIVIQILFHVLYSVGVAVKERSRDDSEVERIIASEAAEDELDQIIALKASHAGYLFTGLGFIAALAWLAFWGASAVAALHIMFAAIFIGTFVEGCLSIRFYERGF